MPFIPIPMFRTVIIRCPLGVTELSLARFDSELLLCFSAGGRGLPAASERRVRRLPDVAEPGTSSVLRAQLHRALHRRQNCRVRSLLYDTGLALRSG